MEYRNEKGDIIVAREPVYDGGRVRGFTWVVIRVKDRKPTWFNWSKREYEEISRFGDGIEEADQHLLACIRKFHLKPDYTLT